VRELAADRLADADAWLENVTGRGLQPLTANPATLTMLLEVAAARGGLPKTRAEAYETGCGHLCGRRRRFGTAQRIAGHVVLCAQTAIAVDEVIADRDSSGGDRGAIVDALRCGVFARAGAGRARFRHRTQAEFLCALWLAQGPLGVEQIDDLLFADTDDGRRVPPQLREVAAWLATESPEFAQRLLKHDPVLLLSADPAAWAPADRPVLVQALLSAIGSARVRRSDLSVRNRLPHLCHPGLSDQLRVVLNDPRADARRRETAADLAGACRVERLEGDLLALACDPAAPPSVRAAATGALSRFASSEARSGLIGLATAPPDEGVGDDLRGAALTATWPDVLSFDRLLASLTLSEPVAARGAFGDFLRRDLVDGLRDDQLASALRWAATLPVGDGRAGDVTHLREALLVRSATRLLDDDDVVDAYADLVVRLLAASGDVLSSDANGRHPDVFGDRRCRRRLVAALVTSARHQRDLDPAVLATSTPPLARPEDVAWAISQLTDGVGTSAEQRWAKLVDALLVQGADPDAVVEARASSRALARLTDDRFEQLEIGPTDAGELRDIGSTSRRFRQPPFDVRDKVARAIELWDDGDLDGFWAALAWMDHVERGAVHGSLTSDARRLRGWPLVDGDVHAWVLAAAPRYLRAATPDPHEWHREGRLERPAWAGYVALRLLHEEDPVALSSLGDEIWRRWAPVVVGWPRHDAAEAAFNDWAVAQLVRRAPEDAAAWLRDALARNASDGNQVVRRFAGSLIEPVQAAILDHASDRRLPWRQRAALIDFLLAERSAPGWRLARRMVTAATVRAPGERRQRAVEVACRLAAHAPDADWPRLRRLVGLDDEFGRALISTLAAGEQPIYERLTEPELADLFEWIESRFPRRAERPDAIAGHEWISAWQEQLLATLVARGTEDAVLAFDGLIETLPHLAFLDGMRADAAEAARHADWIAPVPTQLASMLDERERRWVTSDAALRRVVVTVLRRGETELQERDDGAARPPDLTSWVSAYLRQELGDPGSVIGRAVQVRSWGEGRAGGEHVALRVDAVAEGESSRPPVVSIIVDVEPGMSADALPSLDARLEDGRLRLPHRHSIYVMGYPNSGERDQGPSAKVRRQSIDELRASLARQAADVSARRGVDVEVVILDGSRPTRLANGLWEGPNRRLISLTGLLLTLLLACLIGLSVGAPARGIVAFAVLLTVPGAAILTRMRDIDPLVALLSAVILSLTVETAVALIMIWTGWWYPAAAAAALLAGSCAVFVHDLWPVRARGHGAHALPRRGLGPR
jgi:hypothetical protein